jgi:HPt (histidine-containing phosphotransfer) domain-containing protein
LARHHPPDVLAVLDGDAVDRLHDLATHVQRPGETLLADLTTLFANDSSARCDRLRAACANGDIEQIRKIAHALKGAALNMGAKHVVSLCSQLEAADNLHADEVRSCVDEIASACADAASLWRRITAATSS